LLVLLGGCGVATQDQAQPLPSGAFPVADPGQTSDQTALETELFFVSGPGLEPVSEAITNRTARGVLAALHAGPPADRSNDLRTLINEPLEGTQMLSVTSVEAGGLVILARTDDFTLLPAQDQILLVGQVVSSLDDIGLTEVLITDPDGMPVPLALPDGRVLEGPARAEDYESLLITSPSDSPTPRGATAGAGTAVPDN
jgi:hypothetical protein